VPRSVTYCLPDGLTSCPPELMSVSMTDLFSTHLADLPSLLLTHSLIISWLTYWQHVWLTASLVDWLIAFLTDWMFVWPTTYLTDLLMWSFPKLHKWKTNLNMRLKRGAMFLIPQCRSHRSYTISQMYVTMCNILTSGPILRLLIATARSYQRCCCRVRQLFKDTFSVEII
jgi:hypothetical protein